MLGVVIRNEFDPEMVIKPQIEQGAVEIQKYRFDLVPVDHKFSARVPAQQPAESMAASYSSVPAGWNDRIVGSHTVLVV